MCGGGGLRPQPDLPSTLDTRNLLHSVHVSCFAERIEINSTLHISTSTYGYPLTMCRVHTQTEVLFSLESGMDFVFYTRI